MAHEAGKAAQQLSEVDERLESLGPLLEFFCRTTGLAADLKVLVEPARQLRSVVKAGTGGPLPCRVLLGDPELAARCCECDLYHLQLAHQLKRHIIYECHAGMVDIVAPVLGLPVKAGVFTGQVVPRPLSHEERERLVRRVRTPNHSLTRLRRAFAKTRFMPEERIEAAAQLLMDLTEYGMRTIGGSDSMSLKTYVASELLKRQEWHELEGIARLAGVASPPRVVAAVQVVSPGWRQDVDWRGLHRAREVVAHLAPAALGVVERDKLVVLWPEAEGIEAEIRRLLGALRAAGLRVAIGVGRPCDQAGDVWRSYHEAEMALGYRFLTEDPVIFLERMERYDQRAALIPSALQKLALLVRLGDCARAQEMVRTVVREMRRQPYSGSWVLDSSVEVLSLLIRALREAGNRSEALPGILRHFLTSANQAATTQEVLGLLETNAMRLVSQMESTASRTADLVEQVCEHVRSHLTEPVTLTELCKEVLFVCPDHFSRVFRRVKGMRFTEWVLQQRMERAKELLASTNQAISAVAGRCGYGDPHYFSRVFRAALGMTPTQYRQNPRSRSGVPAASRPTKRASSRHVSARVTSG